MDRSWMSEPRTTTSYKDGVEYFLSVAYRDVSNGTKILCPCVKCRNRIAQDCDRGRTHLRCDGILQSYEKWVHHGEKYDAPQLVFAPVSSNSNNCTVSNVHRNIIIEGVQGRSDDMEGLLKAAFVGQDIYDSVSSTSIGEQDDLHFDSGSTEPNIEEERFDAFGDDHFDSQPDTFASFLKDANTRLYNGCQKFSRLSFLVTLYHQKCIHGWTQESFTALLGVLSDALPQEANLPRNCYEAKKIIRGLGLDYQKIHACPNDCMLFRGDKANQESCHVCGSSRWKTDKNGSPIESKGKKGKKKPAKVLRYFPLIPRLQRLFSAVQTSGDMRWHEEGRTKDGLLRHPADGEAWKDFNDRYPKFSADSRNVRLGLASDGFNPFRNMSSKHSTWPVMLIPYNLPPWVCMKETSLILSMIIPGPNSPGNDIDIYLEPLVDELMKLWEGVETYDASACNKFSLRAALLWTLNDFPALAYLYGWSTGGKYACPSCAIFTKSFRLKKGGKFCYMGHRRWLPRNHKYRKCKNQFDGIEEKDFAPKTMDGSSVLRMLQGRVFVLGKKMSLAVKGKKGKNAKTSSASKAGNHEPKRKRDTSGKKSSKPEKKPEDWLKKRSIFFMLPYWVHNKLRHNLDVMHIEKNVCDNLIGTLLDINSKTKDDLNARLDLVEIDIRPKLHPTEDAKGKQICPPAPFTMSREKKEILCSVIQSIRTPDGYASNISRCVNMKECTLNGMKSHDCHVLIEDILPIALRSCYPSKDVMKIVVELAAFLKTLCSKVIVASELDRLQESIVMTLCDMERIFLPSFFTIMVHLLVHLVEEVKLGGPVHYHWMYPLERSFVGIKALVRNRAYPEGSIAEGYLAQECLTFCSRFLEGTTRFNRPSRNPEPSDKTKDIYLFGSAGEPIGNSIIVGRYDNQLLVQSHRYVLRHCDELEEFRKEFIIEEKSKLPQLNNLTHSNVEKLINRSFADWLEQKVLNGADYIDEKIKALAGKPNKCVVRYSGYIINGFRFHTMSREANHTTQNSGLVNIADDGVNYYGRLSDIIELSYRNYKVVVFKCDWYDVHHRSGIKKDEFGFTLVNFSRKIHTGDKFDDDPFVFSSQAQVFYVEDPKMEGWHVVTRFRPRDVFDMGKEQVQDEME